MLLFWVPSAVLRRDAEMFSREGCFRPAVEASSLSFLFSCARSGVMGSVVVVLVVLVVVVVVVVVVLVGGGQCFSVGVS